MDFIGNQIAILREHGMKTRFAGYQLQAFEVATALDENGAVIDASSWVDVPKSMRGMYEWLGY